MVCSFSVDVLVAYMQCLITSEIDVRLYNESVTRKSPVTLVRMNERMLAYDQIFGYVDIR